MGTEQEQLLRIACCNLLLNEAPENFNLDVKRELLANIIEISQIFLEVVLLILLVRIASHEVVARLGMHRLFCQWSNNSIHIVVLLLA